MKKILLTLLLTLSVSVFANTDLIEFIVPTPPGGAPDIMARAISHSISTKIDIPIVVLNRSGAGGMLATREFLTNNNKTNRILLASTSITLHQNMKKPDSINLIEELDLVGPIASTPLGLIVRSTSNYKTFSEFIAYAKKNEVNCGTIRPIVENSVVYLADKYSLKIRMIPYPSTSSVKVGILSNQVDCTVDIYGAYKDFHKTGEVTYLGFFLRNKFAPDIPVIPGNNPRLESATSVAIHNQMKPELRAKIVKALSELRNDQEFVELMNSLGFQVDSIDPDWKNILRKERKLLDPIIEKAAALE